MKFTVTVTHSKGAQVYDVIAPTSIDAALAAQETYFDLGQLKISVKKAQ